MKKQWLILNFKHLLDKLHFIVIFIIILSIAILHKFFYIILIIYILYLYKNKILNKLGYIIIILYSLSLIVSLQVVTINNDKVINGTCYVIDRSNNKLTVSYKGKNYYLNSFSEAYPGDFIIVEGKILKRDTSSYDGDTSQVLNDASKYISGYIEGKIIRKTFNIYTFKRIRFRILEYYSSRLSSESFDFIFSLVLGKSKSVDSINKLNLTHILVVSGFHLNLLYSVCYMVLFKLIKKPYLCEKITLALLTLYSLVCGLQISLLRALIMLFINFFNEKKKVLTRLDVFSLTFLILLIKPLYIYNMSFILSFLSSFIIMYLNDVNKCKRNFFKKMSDNLIVFLVLLPVLTNFSNYFSVFFIMSFVFVDYFCYLLIPLSFISLIFTKADNIYVLFLNSIISLMDNLSAIGIFNIPYMNIYIKIGYYFLLFILVLFSKKKVHKLLFIIVLTVFSFKFYFISEQVVFIDVKQGDCTLIKNEECTYLIDCHNCFSYLGKSGVKKLDAIFISHEDYDHISDLEKIFKNIEVSKVYTSEYCLKVREICAKYYINYQSLKVYDSLYMANDHIKVLSPIKDHNESNANSLVLEIYHNYKSFLFTGDLTKEVEKELIKNNLLNKVDVLKVGHHGSNTSSSKEFLEIIRPKVSVVSVSRNNKYNLPNNEVIKLLMKYSNVYLTSKSGNITLKNNSFKTYK